MKRISFMMMVAVLSFITARAQVSVPVEPLQVGDTVPDVVLKKLINYKKGSAKLADFKGKLLIFDFWASWCVPCLQGFSRLQSLQKEFGNDIVILPVNKKDSKGENEANARSVFKRRKIELPSVVEDDVLYRLFEHRALPHEVWIDKNGVVIAFTSEREVTRENIRNVLSGRMPAMAQKIDFHFDSKKPLGGVVYPDSAIRYRSVLYPYREGVNGIVSNTVKNHHRRALLTHKLPYDIFVLAGFGGVGMYNKDPRRIDWQVSDTLKYTYPASLAAFPNRYFQSYEEFLTSRITYELIMPRDTPDSLFYSHLLSEANKLFPLKGSVERRLLPCWLLVRTDTATNLLKAKGGKSMVSYNKNAIALRNASMQTLKWLLGHFRNNDEVFDETGYAGKIDITLDYRQSKTYDVDKGGLITSYPMDVELIQKELARYNLALVRSERMQNVLVLSDKPEVYSQWGL